MTKHPGAWLTIGSFDGVHVGHQKIIQALVNGARKDKTASVIVTFFPHPVKVLRPFPDPFYLSSPEEKDQVISRLGVTSLLTLEFSRELAQLSAEDFMTMLHNRLKFSCLLIGYDFKLGANREGDFNRLTVIGEQLGYCVRSFEAIRDESNVISSSMARKLISDGELHKAKYLLGRPYLISGQVVHGDGRGRHIGIPTANIQTWDEKILPKPGVYAALAAVNGKKHAAVVNIGSRPTFYKPPAIQTIEVHLLDFQGDIYGHQLELSFIERLRGEHRFDSADALILQIQDDISKSREMIENALKP